MSPRHQRNRGELVLTPSGPGADHDSVSQMDARDLARLAATEARPTGPSAAPRGLRERDCLGLVLDADPAQVPADPAIVGGRLGGDQIEHGFAAIIGILAVAERVV